MIKAVLFDLDGTLLPMDIDVFAHEYFTTLADFLAPYGYEKRTLIHNILKGTEAMVKNDGQRTNEQVFWDSFAEAYGKDAREDEVHFTEYYEQNFDRVKDACTPTLRSREILFEIKRLGLRTILATNPIFPRIATEHRLRWIGLSYEDFEFYTTYENSSYSKPNLRYYESILQKIGLRGEECLMVGNDAIEDTVAEKLGMKIFLLSDCLLNRDGRDVSSYPQGNFDDLLSYVHSLI